jgi:hypothetical protein
MAGPARIISLPSYVLFRLIVTYFALETLLTVPLRKPRWRSPVPIAQRRARAVVLPARETVPPA